ncbi:MAG: hypothetical protein HYW69_03215 [Candidatus Nealsonbacteria bacterium]|nr:hypothetical protein [Candidatus Nealsonbacteria bacterium]
MKKRYTVDECKNVMWDSIDGREPNPTLAEIIEAAKKEFPGIPYEQLEVCGAGDGTFLSKK